MSALRSLSCSAVVGLSRPSRGLTLRGGTGSVQSKAPVRCIRASPRRSLTSLRRSAPARTSNYSLAVIASVGIHGAMSPWSMWRCQHDHGTQTTFCASATLGLAARRPTRARGGRVGAVGRKTPSSTPSAMSGRARSLRGVPGATAAGTFGEQRGRASTGTSRDGMPVHTLRRSVLGEVRQRTVPCGAALH